MDHAAQSAPDRADFLSRRRDRLAQTWDLKRGLVLVPSGLSLPVSGSDRLHPFNPHATHVYLSGSRHEAQVLAYDHREGWVLFLHDAGPVERLWTGPGADPDEVKARTGLSDVRTTAQLAEWLEERTGEPVALLGNPDLLNRPRGYGLEDVDALRDAHDEEMSRVLGEEVDRSRRTKDALELHWLRRAARASRAGFLDGMRATQPGRTELELKAIIEAGFAREGGDGPGYGTIVASGRRAAVLHPTPDHKEVAEGELILVDAGAHVEGYTSDNTRTFPAGWRFTAEQRDLYALVLEIQETAIEGCRAGVEFLELHLAAAAQMTRGLLELGYLRGDLDTALEKDAHFPFFPHGLGHFVGLEVHDVGAQKSKTVPERRALRYVRGAFRLAPGDVFTVEPGCYFVAGMLEDEELREDLADVVDWERFEAMLDFGGIRIEDNVVVTEGAPLNLTEDLPKSIEEIENLRAEAMGA